MKVAGIQSDIVWEDREANFKRLRPRIAAAATAGAQLVVLPEMFARGFSMDTASIEEPTDGPTAAFLAEMATTHGLWITGSIPERSPGSGRPRNTMVLAGPDGQAHRYEKIHPFTFASEHEHYDAGSSFATVTVGDLRCTLFICYDLRFADEFWSTAQRTDCYVVVANWPKKRRAHWSALLRARAIENQAYVVGVNRVGSGGGLEYSGDSAIIDPWGEVLTSGAMTETTLLAEVSPQVVADARSRFPVLRDRR